MASSLNEVGVHMKLRIVILEPNADESDEYATPPGQVFRTPPGQRSRMLSTSKPLLAWCRIALMMTRLEVWIGYVATKEIVQRPNRILVANDIKLSALMKTDGLCRL